MRRLLQRLLAVLRPRKAIQIPQGLTPAERRALLGAAPFSLDKKTSDNAMETRGDPA